MRLIRALASNRYPGELRIKLSEFIADLLPHSHGWIDAVVNEILIAHYQIGEQQLEIPLRNPCNSLVIPHVVALSQMHAL